MKQYIYFLFILFYGVASAQENESLNFPKQLEELDSLAHINLNKNPHVAKDYCYQAVTLVKEHGKGVKEKEAHFMYILGEIYYNISRYDSALYSFKHASRIFKIKNNLAQTANCYLHIAKTNLKLGNYTESIQYNELSLDIYDKIGDKIGLAKVHSNIGNLYWYLNNLKKAEYYYLKAKEVYSEIGDKPGLAITYNNLGEIMKSGEDYERAAKYYSLSLEYERENGNDLGIATSLNNMGELFLNQKDYGVAKEYFLQALEVYGMVDNVEGEALVLFNLCKLEIDDKKYLKGLTYLERGEELIQDFDFPEVKVKVYELYAQIYSNIGEYEKAYSYLLKYHFFADSLTNKKNKQTLQALQIKHEVDRSEKEIESLSENNQIKEKQLNNQLLIIYLTTGVGLFILVFLFVINRKNKQHKQINKLLSKEQYSLQQAEKLLKAKNEELQKNEKRFRSIVENIPVIITAVDKNGAVVFWNKQAEFVSGYTTLEMNLGSTKLANLFLADSFLFDVNLEKHNKNFKNKECELTCKDTSRKIIQWHNISATVHVNGWYSWYIGIDITQRKQFEKSIQREKNILRSIINTIPDPIFVKDTKSQYLGCNPAFEKLIGYTQEQIFGKSDQEVETDTRNAFISKNDNLTLQCGTKYQEEIWAELSNGNKALYDLRKVPIYTQQNQISGLVGILFDITKRHEFAKMLEKEKIKAQNADKLKTVFLANMSHEIRTPMNAIIGFSDLLMQKDVSESKRTKYLNYIKSSGKNLLNLINDIIDIAKIEAQQLKYEKQLFPVLTVLKEINLAFQTIKKSMPEKEKVELRLIIPSNIEKIFLKSDPYRFRQVFNNLIGNALKFTEEGYIHFGVKYSENSEVVFFVEDTGVGIPAEKHEHIFTRFGQVDETYVKNKTGTGLGLAISKSLVEILGGQMWLKSEENKGANFMFTLQGIQFPEKESKKELFDDNEVNILLLSKNYLNKVLLKKSLKNINAYFYETTESDVIKKLVLAKKINFVFMDSDFQLSSDTMLEIHQNNINIVYQLSTNAPNENEIIKLKQAKGYLTANFKQSDVLDLIYSVIKKQN